MDCLLHFLCIRLTYSQSMNPRMSEVMQLAHDFLKFKWGERQYLNPQLWVWAPTGCTTSQSLRHFFASRSWTVSQSSAAVFNLMFHSQNFPRLLSKTQPTLSSCFPILSSSVLGLFLLGHVQYKAVWNPDFLSSGTSPLPSFAQKKPKRQPRHTTPSFEKEGWRHNPCPNYFQAVRRCLCNAQVLSTHLLNYVNGRDFTSFSISIGHITNSLHFTLVFDHTRQLVAVLPRASYLTTLYHCFLLCEMGEIISPFQVHCRDQITKATY